MSVLAGTALAAFGVAYSVQVTRHARDLQVEVDARRDVQRRVQHAAQMAIAATSFRRGLPDVARAMIEKPRPAPGEPDLRSFERRCLWDMLHRVREVHVPEMKGDFNPWSNPGEVSASTDGSIVAAGYEYGGLPRVWKARWRKRRLTRSTLARARCSCRRSAGSRTPAGGFSDRPRPGRLSWRAPAGPQGDLHADPLVRGKLSLSTPRPRGRIWPLHSSMAQSVVRVGRAVLRVRHLENER